MDKNMNESTKVIEDTEKKDHLTKSDLIELIVILAVILAFIAVPIGSLDFLGVFKDLSVHRQEKSISAGIITDKEIINGTIKNKNYVPTIYRIYIKAEFEYDNEGSNYFDVSEDTYNLYRVGDYFDSKDLLRAVTKSK